MSVRRLTIIMLVKNIVFRILFLRLLYKVVFKLGVDLFLVAQKISDLKSEFINLSRNYYTKSRQFFV